MQKVYEALEKNPKQIIVLVHPDNTVGISPAIHLSWTQTGLGPAHDSSSRSCLLLSVRSELHKKCSTEEEAGNIKDRGSNTSHVWSDEETQFTL